MHPLLLVSIALAARNDVPDAVADWADRFDLAYAHFRDVGLAWGADSTVGPDCTPPDSGEPLAIVSSRDDALKALYDADPAAFIAGCQALSHTSWELRIDLQPTDRRVFSPQKVRVLPTQGGRPATEIIAAAVQYGANASKASQVLIAADTALVELTVPCGSAAMFAYEAADLLTALTTAGLSTGDQVAWSECGAAHFNLKPTTWVMAEAQKPREFWGVQFPEARDRARTIINSAEIP